MLNVINNDTLITEQEVKEKYPNSMYIMRDIKDVNNVAGVLVAVSTSKDSYRDICVLRKELADKGQDCALLGSYNGGNIGVLNTDSGGQFSKNHVSYGNEETFREYVLKSAEFLVKELPDIVKSLTES